MNFKVCIFFSAVIILLSPERTNASVTTFACEHETPVRVKCPSLYVIDVIDAFYGRLEHNRCGSSSIANCKAGNSLTVIKQNCQGENSCSLEASNLVFGDPCRGVGKYIKLVYDCLPAGKKRTTYACEHQPSVRVQCTDNYAIDVLHAFYGRLESDRCGFNANVNCVAGTSSSIIERNCQDKNSCLLEARNNVFGDPCVGAGKYIRLDYDCIAPDERRTRFACEHQPPVSVRCPDNYVINVIDAFYGRLEKERCGWNANDQCKAGNAPSIIKENCQGQNFCVLEASNGVFGDPCRGVGKYIKLVYDCQPSVSEIRTTYACEHQSPVQVQCPEYFRIDAIDAFYGRVESDKCGYNTNTNCKAENSLSIIKNKCQYENTCLLTAENSLFGDPCAGVVKYSKLVYQCVPTEKERLAVACEHEKDLTVTCPDGYVIIVHYAFYGRDDLTTCRQGQTDSNCRANGSNEKVQRVCRGRNTCVLSPKNSVFGDPCSGVVKFIKMYYSCVPSEEL